MLVRNPRPFGFRIRKRIKRRLAKKFIGQQVWYKFSEFHNHKGLVNTCTGFNALPRIIESNQWFCNGKLNKWFVRDFDIHYGLTNTCSLIHCVDKPKTYEECIRYKEFIVKFYSEHPDDFRLRERYEKIELNNDGTIKREK